MTNLGFLLFYVIGMIPTYILPYFGSNSYLAQAAVAALTKSSFGLSWTILHIGALAVCVIAAWARGKTIGKSWLVALPIVATLFDLAPGLNVVPLVATILHVVALVSGFQQPAVALDEEMLPDQRLILLMLAGVVGLSFAGAGANFAFATAKAAYEAKVAKEEEDKRAEQARMAAEKARVEREAAAAKKAEEEAAAKAAQQKAMDEALAKFKEIEIAERAKYDEGEKLMAHLSNVEVQARLNKFASALNRGDADAAGRALGVPIISVYPFVTHAANLGGVSNVTIREYNLSPGTFRFDLVHPPISNGQAKSIPTGYTVNARNSAMAVEFRMVGLADHRSGISNRIFKGCVSSTFTSSFDTERNQMTGALIKTLYSDTCGQW